MNVMWLVVGGLQPGKVCQNWNLRQPSSDKSCAKSFLFLLLILLLILSSGSPRYERAKVQSSAQSRCAL